MSHTVKFCPVKSDFKSDFKELPLSPPEPDYNYSDSEMSGDMIPTNDDEDSFEELQRESQLQRELQQKRAEELIEKLQRENEFKRS